MPGLLSSPVFLTVIWFLLSWSLGPSHAQIWTDEVSDVQYGRLGSNVTLECGKSEIGIPVEWRHNHSLVLPWHKVTSDGRLVLYHVDQSAQGNYSCYDNSGILRSISLRLGHPPGLLSISCQVPNHTHVRCSWRESVKTFLPAGFNASFRGKGQEWRPCIVDVTHRHCDVHHPAFWQTIHMLRVIETNALGSETTLAQLKLHELLKPDPPESVSAKEVEGFPKKLRVTWHYPSSWPQEIAFPLLFHIRYKPHGSKLWSEIFTEDNAVVVPDALAGHLHQVQVRARDEVDPESQWSEWTQLHLVRPWEEEPNPGPEENTESPDCNGFCIEPSASTKPTHAVNGDEGNLGLAILLVLFSIFILTTVLSLIFIVWMRQKRTEHATKQELASMVKMKSIPI
ncbi:interleukin-11 receptor subunit alpha [Austrofundulus limnaeus]|uniref:Interleukin-11 receptor subunit alpha n=1 Tax=Austrofundulus limnaeus TaxID=52670 RepID=A0A2I4AR48_AUSLI|nr:PREDICTED: ciliary neurotrophic factor receptor subunit alpha-like [Austrofundulus limnaeus]